MKNWIRNVVNGAILTLTAVVLLPIGGLMLDIFFVATKRITIVEAIDAYNNLLKASKYVLFHSIDDGVALLDDAGNGDVISVLRKLGL